MSSEKVEKHLIIAVGERFYLALAKGPINSQHVLILSTQHIPCAAQLSLEDWEELLKFKNALRKLFKSLGQVACFTERHYKTSHLIIDVIGFEEGYAWKIKHSFEVIFRLHLYFVTSLLHSCKLTVYLLCHKYPIYNISPLTG